MSTPMDKKTPVTAPTVNEGNEQLATGSNTQLYLYRSNNRSQKAFTAQGGELLPYEDYILAVVPRELLDDLSLHGAQRVNLNPGCVEAHNAAVRKAREERIAKERDRLRRHLTRVVEEEDSFKEQLEILDAQANEIYKQIDLQVEARLTELDRGLSTEEGQA